MTAGKDASAQVEGRFFQVPNSAIQTLEVRANVSLLVGTPRVTQMTSGTLGPAVGVLIPISGPLQGRGPLLGVRFRRDTKKPSSVLGLEVDCYAHEGSPSSCPTTGCNEDAVPCSSSGYEASYRPSWGRIYGELGPVLAGFFSQGPDRGVAQGAQGGFGVDVDKNGVLYNLSSRLLWFQPGSGGNVFAVQVGVSGRARRSGTDSSVDITTETPAHIPTMRVTTWAEYGLIVSLSLARRVGDGPVAARELAEAERLPHDYVEQILLRLRRAGLVKSVRGAKGGYLLARDAHDVSVKNVMEASEHVTFEVNCDRHQVDAHRCSPDASCSIRPVWRMLERRINDFLSGVTLADLTHDEASLYQISGVSRPPAARSPAPMNNPYPRRPLAKRSCGIPGTSSCRKWAPPGRGGSRTRGSCSSAPGDWGLRRRCISPRPGVGTLGVVDADRVDASNLQRQVLHGTSDVGRLKTESAAARLRDLNPHVEVETFAERLTSANGLDLLRPFDVIVDGSDNFQTRYLVNDACVLLDKPDIYGAIFRFDGQASVFGAHGEPCYRCLFADPPPPDLVPSCAEAGVLGVLPGIIGSIQATEALKLILGIGQSLAGRLLLFDALKLEFLGGGHRPGPRVSGVRPPPDGDVAHRLRRVLRHAGDGERPGRGVRHGPGVRARSGENAAGGGCPRALRDRDGAVPPVGAHPAASTPREACRARFPLAGGHALPPWPAVHAGARNPGGGGVRERQELGRRD